MLGIKWKATFKKLGKCIGVGILGAVLNHYTGDNDNGSTKTDLKTAILVGAAAAIKTEINHKKDDDDDQ